LADELRAISREIDATLAAACLATAELDRRFVDEHGALEALFESVQDAKSGGFWRNTRFNVFDISGRCRSLLQRQLDGEVLVAGEVYIYSTAAGLHTGPDRYAA
jgi:hypothetical protein